MTSRAPAVKRLFKPLAPTASVVCVVDDTLIEIPPGEVTPQAVGLKAFGLASLPAVWTCPFFVVPKGSAPTPDALQRALRRLGLNRRIKLIVRSSGVDESMERRGALDSAECDATGLPEQIQRLRTSLKTLNASGDDGVHWVVQQLLPTMAKGHLSNEARVAEHKRDWIAEVEASSWHSGDTRPISLRLWRDSRPAVEAPLVCQYRENYTQSLAIVAKWAYARLARVHFEWVWDGHAVYLVQADRCDESIGGVQPRHLVQVPKKGAIETKRLNKFREASPADYRGYRKLANASLYRDLGYEMVPFYVLDQQDEIQDLIKSGRCSDALRADLEVLVARPLVIRSDGVGIPDDLKQMLPRSQELRTVEAAEAWLVDGFRKGALSKSPSGNASLADCAPCLIAHHFVPATAAAWCQARPDHRRVRIESLWGLPEGLYWYAYDAFDVDTQTSSASQGIPQPEKMRIRQRVRHKDNFVAPDVDGNWVLHKTASGPDWQRSIKQTAWIEEIAWTSRRIAAAVGHPVVVMWFVDVPTAASKHKVLPWYHEHWRADASPHKAAPRRKLSATTDFVLRNKTDWEELKFRIESGDLIVRVRVQPSDPDIVREREFAEQLAAFAKQHQLVVELEGGVLSHAYYMLTRAGCTVECADLDDYATEELALEFNKLVRDKIPLAISDRGEAVTALRLEGEALIAALRRKLVEESLEVLEARTTEDIAEEIADVREVLLALMSRLRIEESDVESRRKRKAKSRGTFDDALMLTKTAVAPSMGFKELQADGDHDSNLVAATINREAEIPQSIEDMHVDRRVDAAGVQERQFTLDVPVHAEGYESTRVPFSLHTQNDISHEMVFELLLTRKNADLRVRARLRNALVQLPLDLGETPSPRSSE